MSLALFFYPRLNGAHFIHHKIVRRGNRWCCHWFRGRSRTHCVLPHLVHQKGKGRSLPVAGAVQLTAIVKLGIRHTGLYLIPPPPPPLESYPDISPLFSFFFFFFESDLLSVEAWPHIGLYILCTLLLWHPISKSSLSPMLVNFLVLQGFSHGPTIIGPPVILIIQTIITSRF